MNIKIIPLIIGLIIMDKHPICAIVLFFVAVGMPI